MKLLYAYWTVNVNMYVIACECGTEFARPSNRWRVQCPQCREVARLSVLRAEWFKLRTRVVNIYVQTCDVYIGRARAGRDGYFGNPYAVRPGKLTREQALEKYRAYFFQRLRSDKEFRERVKALKGCVLGCYCKPRACHGDVIAAYLNQSKHRRVCARRK